MDSSWSQCTSYVEYRVMSCYFFHCQQKHNFLKNFTSVYKFGLQKSQNSWSLVFFLFFCFMIKDIDPDPYLGLLDPEGPKTCGSGKSGFGSGTLLFVRVQGYDLPLSAYRAPCTLFWCVRDPDPKSGALLTPGQWSDMGKKSKSGIRTWWTTRIIFASDPDPQHRYETQMIVLNADPNTAFNSYTDQIKQILTGLQTGSECIRIRITFKV
jgi:hypothetical protein